MTIEYYFLIIIIIITGFVSVAIRYWSGGLNISDLCENSGMTRGDIENAKKTGLNEYGFDPMVGIKKHNIQSNKYTISNPRVVVEIEQNGVKHTITKNLTVKEFMKTEWRSRPLAIQCVDEFKDMTK